MSAYVETSDRVLTMRLAFDLRRMDSAPEPLNFGPMGEGRRELIVSVAVARARQDVEGER